MFYPYIRYLIVVVSIYYLGGSEFCTLLLTRGRTNKKNRDEMVFLFLNLFTMTVLEDAFRLDTLDNVRRNKFNLLNCWT
jgi:hypothetical protein